MDMQKRCIPYNDFLCNVSTTVHQLRQENDFCDVTLVAEEAQMNAHKVILASGSTFFRKILKRNPHPNPLVYLKGVKFIHLQSAIEYMYEGSVTLNQSEVEPFLALGQDLGLKGLAAETRKDYNGNVSNNSSLAGKGNQGVDSSNSKLLRKGDEKPKPNNKEATAPSTVNQVAPPPTPQSPYPEDQVKRKNTSLDTEFKRHCSTNLQEGHKKKMNEHDTKGSSYTDTEMEADVSNQDTNAVQGNYNAGTHNVTKEPLRVMEQQGDWDSRFKKNKLELDRGEDCLGFGIETEQDQLDVSLDGISNKEDRTERNFSANFQDGQGNYNARSENPRSSPLSVSEMNQQELRQELLSQLKYRDDDDNHSVYSDFNAPSLASLLPETDGLTDISPDRSSNKEDRTKRNLYANFQEDKEEKIDDCTKKESTFHQHAIGENDNARSENSPDSLALDSEMNQQKLRQELLNGLNDQDNDDNSSLYSDYNPPSLGSRPTEIDGMTDTYDEEFEEALSAVLTRVGFDWLCKVCERKFTLKGNAKRHIQKIHYNKTPM